MSVKLMSAIFETEFRDMPMPEGGKAKASSLKVVCLALADCGNDDGDSIYPGMTRLCVKTGLSKQGLIDVLSALKYNGLVSVEVEASKLGTNQYNLNMSAFPGKIDGKFLPVVVKPLDQSSHLTGTGKATLLGVVKPLDYNHTLTVTEPPSAISRELTKDEVKETLDGLDARIAADRPGATIRVAFERFFNINVNWDTKQARQWLEWARGEGITPLDLEKAAKVWDENKAFSWQRASLKGVFEAWPALMKASKPKQTFNKLPDFDENGKVVFR